MNSGPGSSQPNSMSVFLGAAGEEPTAKTRKRNAHRMGVIYLLPERESSVSRFKPKLVV
jgi:hypothetical protein